MYYLDYQPKHSLAWVQTVFEDDKAEVVVGTRLRLLGRRIERSRKRHIMSRAFAMMASAACGARLYDTQCGAKLFRATPELKAALSDPFTTGWAFDVELLARLRQLLRNARKLELEDVVHEFPLRRWADPGGSKLKTADIARMAWGLCTIASRYRVRKSWQPPETQDAQERTEEDGESAMR